MGEADPQDLPVYRSEHRARSPDGRWLAEVTDTLEVVMGSPRLGRLRLDGLALANCSPAFVWSDDSRWLAVAQGRFFLGLALAQRVLLIDTAERRVLASKGLAAWLQAEAIAGGQLRLTANPFRRPRAITIDLERARAEWRALEVAWGATAP